MTLVLIPDKKSTKKSSSNSGKTENDEAPSAEPESSE
jgi:hypothetical protein